MKSRQAHNHCTDTHCSANRFRMCPGTCAHIFSVSTILICTSRLPTRLTTQLTMDMPRSIGCTARGTSSPRHVTCRESSHTTFQLKPFRDPFGCGVDLCLSPFWWYPPLERFPDPPATYLFRTRPPHNRVASTRRAGHCDAQCVAPTRRQRAGQI